MIEDDAMAVEIKMEDTKPNHSGFEPPPSSSAVAIDDNEKCHAVIDEDSHTNVKSTKSVVHNNTAVELEEVVCSPPKKRLKKFNYYYGREAYRCRDKFSTKDFEVTISKHQWASFYIISM